MKFITTDKLEKLMTEVMAIVNSKFVTEDKFVNQLATKSDKDHTHNYAGSSSAGGAANSVKTNLTIKLNGGTTEGTNLFTFNGSTAKTINITPSSIGASDSGHSHSAIVMNNCSNKDLNTIKTAGWYFGYTGMTNAPTQAISVLEVIVYSPDWIVQRFTVINVTGKTYERHYYNGNTWSNWKTLYDSNNKPTPADIGAAAASHGTHVEFTAITPSANGTASVGTSSKVARADHIHPLQTSVNGISFWSGTQAQYDAISSKSSTTLYFIID